jgi:hypothetical protein
LHIDIERTQLRFFLGVDIRNELQCVHVYRYTNPIAHFGVDILFFTSGTSDPLQVEFKVCLELFTVELEIADLRQSIKSLYELHSIRLAGGH